MSFVGKTDILEIIYDIVPVYICITFDSVAKISSVPQKEITDINLVQYKAKFIAVT